MKTISIVEMCHFVEWTNMRYFYTSPDGWLADFDISEDPKHITTKQLFRIWRNGSKKQQNLKELE